MTACSTAELLARGFPIRRITARIVRMSAQSRELSRRSTASRLYPDDPPLIRRIRKTFKQLLLHLST
jgi:hypothetical protein